MTPPTHTEPPSRRPHLPDKSRLRDLYEQIAPILAVVTILAALGGVGWSWQNERANDRQDRQRIADTETFAKRNADLLGCFDRLLADLTGGLPIVREATIQRDEAATHAQAANAAAAGSLVDALVSTLSGDVTPDQVQKVVDLYRKYLDANAVLLAASDNLAQVRKDNPTPPPPSTFCAEHGASPSP